MRLGVMVLLLSSLLFAQDTAQQAAQATNGQITQEAARQAIRDAQLQMETAARANQQAMQDAQQANRNAQQPAKVPPSRVTQMPQFSPKPGTFKGITPHVTITDATKGAVIYFTTDGSTPTLKSQTYTGPIAFSATTTLKAMAVAPSFAQSPTARGKYVVK